MGPVAYDEARELVQSEFRNACLTLRPVANSTPSGTPAAFAVVAESARIKANVVSFFRFQHILALIAVIVVGMWFRFSAPFPPWLRDATGAAPYVVCWALVFAIGSGRPRPWAYSNWAFLLTAALEFAQLWRPPWLLAIRRTYAGRLMLGTTFSWWDFPAYFAGLLLSVVILRSLRGTRPKRDRRRGRGRTGGSQSQS